jgi:GNAT superfamily N-acetyltransferase
VRPIRCGYERLRPVTSKASPNILGICRSYRATTASRGAVSNVSKIAFDCLKHGWKPDRFTLVAESREHGRDAIIGEAAYGFDPEKSCGEFAISVADRWQHRGLGSALLCAVQFRAISLGHFELFGETLKTNQEMKNLAIKAGFAFTRSLDWRAVRFDKRLSG